MANDVSRDNEQFIAREIADGVYASRGEALDAAVELLKARGELVARLSESRRQLDEGEYVEFDDAGLIQFFDTLRARAHSRAGTDPRAE